MKIEEIKTIVKLMSENDLTEFKIESEDMTLCLRRGSQHPVISPAVIQAPSFPSAPVSVPAPAVSAVPAAPVNTEVVAEVPAPAVPDLPPEKEKIIESPLVGIFYRANAPGADPFVKVGSKVDPDTTIAVVEAMKVMNEIKAERAGVIKEILLENGQPVEYGQPIFVLE